MAKALKQAATPKSTEPSLQNRIENIGHEKVRLGPPATRTAAAHYLGGSLKSVIALIDKLWQKTYIERRKRQRTTRTKPAA